MWKSFCLILSLIVLAQALSIETPPELQDMKRNLLAAATKKMVCSFYTKKTSTVQIFYAAVTNSTTNQRLTLDIDCVMTVLLKGAQMISNKKNNLAAFYVFVIDDYVGFKLSSS